MGHHSITRDGTVYVNTNPRGEARWTPLATYSEMGFPLPGTEEYKRLYMQTGRQGGKTKMTAKMLNREGDSMQDKIRYVCDSIRDMLLDKNESYGNSALDPVRIFSDADADEQLLVRIDDKLSRIMRGNEYVGDDDITDLIGYLILLKIAREQ